MLATALKRAADEIGLPLSDSDAGRLPGSWGSLPVFDDVEPMLASLRRAGCRLAVLTNCDDDLFEETQRTFRERFDLVVTAERVRDYKPSLAHFRYFARSTGATREGWVHVACSWYTTLRPRVSWRSAASGSIATRLARIVVCVGVPAVGRGRSRRGREASVMTVQQSLAALLDRELAGFQRELDLFPDDEALWRTLPGVSNSAGNLALHVAGGLQHYVGAVLGGSAYVRNRDGEFSRRTGSRGELVEELRKAAVAVRTVVPNLTNAVLEHDFPEAVIPDRRIQTLRFLMHLCAHASFHLGQAGYLRRGLTGQNQSATPVPLKVLTEP